MKSNKCKVLAKSKNIAVVGISSNPDKVSRGIAKYLVNNGYKVVGVNPKKTFKSAEGIKVYNSLLEIPHKIDIVNVFRKSEDIPSLLNDVLSIKPSVLWLQLGIRSKLAEKTVSERKITFVQNSCIKIDHGMCK